MLVKARKGLSFADMLIFIIFFFILYNLHNVTWWIRVRHIHTDFVQVSHVSYIRRYHNLTQLSKDRPTSALLSIKGCS